uniref:DNA-repair protein Xrcc1 N-terminal domain-containing protein n=1 Tax=Denticeps clupeoides TaxID=299321 RepID=A0AAY4C594_9TELE
LIPIRQGATEQSTNGVENLCRVADRSGVLKVELQLEQVAAVGFVDVGNCGSAFIQIDAGRSSWSQDRPYVVLLPTATLMSPVDSQDGRGRHAVRMFKRMWDRLRVTCTQPYRRNAQFGLSFLQVRSPEDTPTFTVQEAPTTPDKRTAVEEWLSSPVVQRTFFGTKTMQKQRHGATHCPSPAASSHQTLVEPETVCPLCGGQFVYSADLLRLHAASCMESEPPTSHSAVSGWGQEAELREDGVSTPCPICGVSFLMSFIEAHASSCGDMVDDD